MMQVKEPVKLRYKKLVNGSTSLYLDIYRAGVRRYDFLHLYLIPEMSAADRTRNQKTLALANAIKAQRIIEMQNSAHGFTDRNRQSMIKFIDYLREEARRYQSKGSKMYAQSVRNSINHLIAYAGDKVTFKQVDKAYLLGYIKFLDGVTARGNKPLSGSSKALYFQVVVTALNRAVKEEIIEKNPAHLINSEDRPESAERQREFLTFEEVRRLIETPCRSEIVKRAFLFSCFCGLRLSDVRALQWKDIWELSDGRMQVRVVQQKTGRPVDIPLSDNAISQLPTQGDKLDKVFQLPATWLVEELLDKWAKSAGINKHVTYHCSRHTHATLLLTYGADIYTVSKLLGHTRVQTTEIYAKIIDKKKQEAVNLIPTL